MSKFESLIQQRLYEHADQKYCVFSHSLIPTNLDMIGVRIPIQKQIAKSVAKEDWEQVQCYLSTTTPKTYEEINVWGLVMAYAKMPESCRQEFLWKFAHHIDNWASCDTIVMATKNIGKNLDTYWDFAVKLVRDDYIFARRVGIVSMLSYYLTDDYIDIVLDEIVQIRDQEYYVQMAIAWLVATALAKHYDKTVKILQDRRLDEWTHNKAIVKACESFRISPAQKEYLRSLR